MLVSMVVIIPIRIIGFIMRKGRPNCHAVKAMAIIDPNGASAENNQDSDQQEKSFHLFFLSFREILAVSIRKNTGFYRLNPVPLIH